MPIQLLKYLRQSLPEIDCPHRRKRREKIRNKVKLIRTYRKFGKFVDSVHYHPALIGLMVFMYRFQ